MQKRPTHAAVANFVSSILPPKPNDVQLLYHVPRHPKYAPDTAVVERIVLSVTPTLGVYRLIGLPHPPASTTSEEILPRPPRTVCFLHRPFALERRRVRRGTLVLASHTSFDEVLTVGWNASLAERLGLDVDSCICVQGYKGDPERKIGMVGQLSASGVFLRGRIAQEFGVVELEHEGTSDEIKVVAIMNAFNAAEVQRVLEMAQSRGWIRAGEGCGRHVLYLTGQPRESGMAVAKLHGVTVVCVGHRAAENWAIRYMASRFRAEFPNVVVEEVYEEETLTKKGD